MKKYFYRIRNYVFPKKHNDMIVKIWRKQNQLKILQSELAKLNHFAEHGFLGDRLLDRQIMLEQNVRTIKNDIFLLKCKYKKAMEE